MIHKDMVGLVAFGIDVAHGGLQCNSDTVCSERVCLDHENLNCVLL